MKLLSAIAGGVAGTATVALLHQALRQLSPDAPRVDKLNKELIRKGLKKLHKEAPDAAELQRWSVGGEIFVDAAYYSLAGLGGKKGVWTRGALMGLVAGVTSVLLPRLFGLKEKPTNKTTATQLMSVGLYFAAGLVAAAVAQAVDGAQTNHEAEAEAKEAAFEKEYETFPAADLVF